MNGWKKWLKEIWNFIWHDNSLLSWIVNIILAFLIVKFIIYPGAGLILATTHPIVAVVSSSMEHDQAFDDWWASNQNWYISRSIDRSDFIEFPFKNGFSKGDIMFLKGGQNIKIGDILVFQGRSNNPIIHRVVKIYEEDGEMFYQTKGDNNIDSYDQLGETKISEEEIVGKAIFKLPYLGWIKIMFTYLITGGSKNVILPKVR